jgi:hypothetical protein
MGTELVYETLCIRKTTMRDKVQEITATVVQNKDMHQKSPTKEGGKDCL